MEAKVYLHIFFSASFFLKIIMWWISWQWIRLFTCYLMICWPCTVYASEGDILEHFLTSCYECLWSVVIDWNLSVHIWSSLTCWTWLCWLLTVYVDCIFKHTTVERLDSVVPVWPSRLAGTERKEARHSISGNILLSLGVILPVDNQNFTYCSFCPCYFYFSWGGWGGLQQERRM